MKSQCCNKSNTYAKKILYFSLIIIFIAFFVILMYNILMPTPEKNPYENSQAFAINFFKMLVQEDYYRARKYLPYCYGKTTKETWETLLTELGEVISYDEVPVKVIKNYIHLGYDDTEEYYFNVTFEKCKVIILIGVSNDVIIDFKYYSGMDIAERFFNELLLQNYDKASNLYKPLHLNDEESPHENPKAKMIEIWKEILEITGNCVSYSSVYYDYDTSSYCFNARFEKGEFVIGIANSGDYSEPATNFVMGYYLKDIESDTLLVETGIYGRVVMEVF